MAQQFPQNLATAFPFWGSEGHQTFRQHYCEAVPDELAALHVRYARMISMMVKGQTAAPDHVYIIEKDIPFDLNLERLEITSLLAGGWIAFDYNGIDYVEYPGAVDINQSASLPLSTLEGAIMPNTTWANWVECGKFYYIVLAFGSSNYRSELVTFIDFPEINTNPSLDNLTHVRLECVPGVAVGEIPPVVNTSQKIFLPGATIEPRYLTTINPSEDGQEETDIIWAKIVKRYTVRAIVPESVADFLSTVFLYTTVNVSDQYGLQNDVTNVEAVISWPEEYNGCLAQVDLSFQRGFFTTECPPPA